MNVSIVTFNIRCANDPDGHAIEERAPRLRAVLDACDADVIGLQECVPSWLPHLEAYTDRYEMDNVWRDTAEGGWKESAPLLWKRDRFTCVERGHFWLSPTPDVESGKEWDTVCHCKRICVWAVLEDRRTGQKLLAANTHFGFGDEGQVNSAHLIARRLTAVGEYPTVITGDYNMRPTAPAYAAMTGHFQDLNPGDQRITYHGYGHAKRPSHIDYGFATPTVKPVSVTLLDQTFDGKYPSDHYGLYFKVEI
ncbi:MAG: hypothetical protein E7541_02775 [Ruminococcaceae bacterium]|nr:hypothetical protein [Oscillospiraceae bacterium]